LLGSDFLHCCNCRNRPSSSINPLFNYLDNCSCFHRFWICENNAGSRFSSLLELLNQDPVENWLELFERGRHFLRKLARN
jgi:hypothetical protein